MKEDKEILEEVTISEAATDGNGAASANETAATDATFDGGELTASVIAAEENASGEPKKLTKKQQFLQFLIFTGFMISAGVIQFVTTGLLSTWTGLMSEDSGYYWIAYLVGLVLSVIWSFTFNRKFTFKAANNVPLAMCLVLLYYCAFTPLSTFGANAIVNAWKDAAGAGWDKNYEMVITASMMLINFGTEFIWDKLVVFNQKVTDKILSWFKKK